MKSCYLPVRKVTSFGKPASVLTRSLRRLRSSVLDRIVAACGSLPLQNFDFAQDDRLQVMRRVMLGSPSGGAPAKRVRGEEKPSPSRFASHLSQGERLILVALGRANTVRPYGVGVLCGVTRSWTVETPVPTEVSFALEHLIRHPTGATFSHWRRLPNFPPTATNF